MTTPTIPSSSPGLLPLIVGVTGHRDLRAEDIAALEASVRSILRELRAQYPHTPLMILSPLGEGADRLVARVGLEEGSSLCVPLPMPLDCYEAQFENDSSRAEFSALLGKAAQVFTLPWLSGERGICEEDAGPSGPVLAAQYAQMGAYVARHSHLFLALWDGDDSHTLTGGTAQVVRFRLEGAPPPYGPSQGLLDPADNGAVCHIVTPRQANSQVKGEPLSRHELLPAGFDVAARERALRCLDRFNCDVVTEPATEQSATSLEWLLPKKELDKQGAPPTGLASILEAYGIADALAIHFQRYTTKILDRVFGLVLVAALCFNLFHSLPHGDHGGDHGTGHGEAHADAAHAATPAAHSAADAGHKTSEKDTTHKPVADSHAPAADSHSSKDSHAPDAAHAPAAHGDAADAPAGHGDAAHADAASALEIASSPWFLWLYLLVVAINVLLHRRAEKQEFQSKYQDYRALAEGMRVQVFWHLANLPDEVADHYLGKQRSELDWIRNALRSRHVLAAHDERKAVEPSSSAGNWLPFIRRQWVQEQKNYFARKAHHELEELERTERRIQVLLACSVGLTIALAVVMVLPLFVSWAPLDAVKAWVELPLPHAWVMISIVMLAVAAGLLHAYNEQKAHAEHSKRYSRMALLFDNADRHLERFLASGNVAESQNLLLELGKEALAENGDWVLLHRERPLQVPHAA